MKRALVAFHAGATLIAMSLAFTYFSPARATPVAPGHRFVGVAPAPAAAQDEPIRDFTY